MSNNSNNPSAPSIDILREHAASAMLEGHGKEAYSSQIDAIVHVMQMATNPSEFPPAPVLLVQPTGGGKSATRNCIGHIAGGVVLTIVPLLSLGADQSTKLRAIIQEKDLPAYVYHLDEYKGHNPNQHLQNLLFSMADDPDVTVFLFCSPQKIVDSKSWQSTLKRLVDRGLLRLVAVDECHLYAEFGLSFRDEFYGLQPVFFDYICSRVSILYMTATASRSVVAALDTLTGIPLQRCNILWPSRPSLLARRQVDVDVLFLETSIRQIKSLCSNYYRSSSSPVKKLIVYTNSLKTSRRLHKLLQRHFDEQGLHGGLVLVNGDLFREEKFHRTTSFLASDTRDDDPNRPGHVLHWQPRVFVATAGAANAGLDDPAVYFVIRDGFPPSLRDLVQELGRAGRRPGASPRTDRILFILSFPSFASLLYRIYIVPHLPTESSDQPPNIPESLPVTQARQYEELLKVVRLFFLQGPCFHCTIEEKQVNPYVPRDDEPTCPCGNACWVCAGNNLPVTAELLKPVSRSGLRRFLTEYFVIGEPSPQQRCLFRGTLVRSWVVFKSAGGLSFSELVFGKKRKKQPPKEVKILLLKLFGTGLLVPVIDDRTIHCRLAVDASSGSFHMADDARWDGIVCF